MNEPRSPETAEEAAKRARDEAALDRKGALKACEACGGEFGAMGLRGFVQLIDDDLIIEPGKGGEMVMAMCRNCGLLRLHSVDLLFMGESEQDAAG